MPVRLGCVERTAQDTILANNRKFLQLSS